MRYRVLGSVALLGPDEDTVEVPGDKLRALLSVLLLKANSWVDTDVVVDAVWGERAPATVRRSLRTNIWQLRKLLDDPAAEESVIAGRTGAYRLNAARSELDTWVFEDLITEGRAALARGEGHSAADMLLSALSLWRGEPYGLLPGGLAGAEAARLSELRWTARKTLADALLAIGETGDAIAVLRAVLAEDPLREPFWCRLVSALHAADRRADALEAYRQARTVLVDELGMDPSAELRAAHQRVLDDEPRHEPAPQVPVALRPLKPEPEPTPEPAPASSVHAHGGHFVDEVPVLRPRRNYLPARPTDFVGRASEIAAVLRVAKAHAAAKTQAPLLVLIDGMPGSGKTSFALEVAHRLADGYPDGQLFLDLRGHRYGVVAATDALHTLLDTLGAGPDGIADGLEARAAQWRARLAQKRAVMLVDDVADAEQLSRLLPASSPSVVLVTSRRRIPPPFGALRVRLDPLAQDEAVEVLTAGLQLRADERELAEEVALTYGRLPAAMRVLNDRLRHRMGWSMQRVANHMRKASGLLRTLRSDAYNAVDAFDASYRRLPAPTQRLLRLLGSSPIFDVDAHAASALADVSLADSEPMLEELAEHNLLSPRTGGRYRLHSLQRVFAAELAASEDSPRRRHLASARLLAYYLRCTMHAVAVAKDDPKAAALDADVPFGTIDSPVTARDWLQLERANLLAVADATSGTQSRRLRDLIVGFDPSFATPDDLAPRRQRAFSAVRMARTGTFTAAAAAVAFAAGSPAGLLADGSSGDGGSVVASWLDAVGSDTSTGGGSTPKQEGEWQGAPAAVPTPEDDSASDDGEYVGKHRLPDGQQAEDDKAPRADRTDEGSGDGAPEEPVDHHRGPGQNRGNAPDDKSAEGKSTEEHGSDGQNADDEGSEDDGGLVGDTVDTATTVVSGEDQSDGEPEQRQSERSNEGGQGGGEQPQSERSARSSEREQEPAEEQAAEEPEKSEPAQEQPAEEPSAEEPKSATGGAGFYMVVGAPPGGNYFDKAADQLAEAGQQMQTNVQKNLQQAQKQLSGALSYYAG